MTDICIDVDVAITAISINKVPLVLDTDGVTIDETVTYNEAGLDLNWNFMTTAGVFTQINVVPTDTAGDYDFLHKGNGMYTIEVPASGGASINNDTEGFGWFSGICTAVAPWISPMYCFRAAALNDALIDGGDNLDVNTVQVSGTSQTANDNGADINAILVDTGTTIPADIADVPTVAEFEARTPTAAQLLYMTEHAATAKPVTFNAVGGSTTEAVLVNVDGVAASSTNDAYKGAILIFNSGTLDEQRTDITAYNGSTKVATITAVTAAVTDSHTALLV